MKITPHSFLRHSMPFAISLLLIIGYSCNSDNTITPPIDQVKEPEVIIIAPEDRLPLLQIHTNGTQIVDEPKIDVAMTITEVGNITFDGFAGIEFRGASSQTFPKKSYGLETRDANGEDLDVGLLGFPEEEDWVLHGPFSDKSLMRNMLIYDLSRDIGQYASRTKFIELEINDFYQGVYVFMEKLKRDDNRININNLNDDENTGEDLTGGYILKIDKTAGSNLGEGYNELNSFESSFAPPQASVGQKINFLYEDPDAEDITTEQKNYISSYVAQFENALSSNDFQDPTLGYAAFIDVPSFIDFFILNEVSNNVDGYRLSTFMHKEKNEKLKMGPIWDFNLAFGNADYCNGGETNVWAYKFNDRCADHFWLVPFWWERLLQDPTFVTQLKERWNVLRGSQLASASVQAKIQGYRNALDKSGAVNANFSAWRIFGTYVWPNRFVGNSYDEEMEYFTTWVDNRMNWLDTAIGGL